MDFEVINTTNQAELLKAIADCQPHNFKIGAGFTDLINQLRHKPQEDLKIINIAPIGDDEYNNIVEQDDNLQIGTLVTASEIVNNTYIKEEFPVLHTAASKLASLQIRNVATLGGNICNVSPSGDMTAAMIALDATCHIIDCDGNERAEKLLSFIRGLKQTSLSKKEVIKYVSIPNNKSNKLVSGFEKVGARKSMEISIVSLAYHLQLNDDNEIIEAGIACGAVAPIIPFPVKACDFIKGKNINNITQDEKKQFASLVLEYASPISDVRASDWYRKEVLFNISQTIFDL